MSSDKSSKSSKSQKSAPRAQTPLEVAMTTAQVYEVITASNAESMKKNYVANVRSYAERLLRHVELIEQGRDSMIGGESFVEGAAAIDVLGARFTLTRENAARFTEVRDEIAKALADAAEQRDEETRDAAKNESWFKALGIDE